MIVYVKLGETLRANSSLLAGQPCLPPKGLPAAGGVCPAADQGKLTPAVSEADLQK